MQWTPLYPPSVSLIHFKLLARSGTISVAFAFVLTVIMQNLILQNLIFKAMGQKKVSAKDSAEEVVNDDHYDLPVLKGLQSFGGLYLW